jgi:hypothetical protein
VLLSINGRTTLISSASARTSKAGLTVRRSIPNGPRSSGLAVAVAAISRRILSPTPRGSQAVQLHTFQLGRPDAICGAPYAERSEECTNRRNSYGHHAACERTLVWQLVTPFSHRIRTNSTSIRVGSELVREAVAVLVRISLTRDILGVGRV